jgi:hypothetical protein
MDVIDREEVKVVLNLLAELKRRGIRYSLKNMYSMGEMNLMIVLPDLVVKEGKIEGKKEREIAQ